MLIVLSVVMYLVLFFELRGWYTYSRSFVKVVHYVFSSEGEVCGERVGAKKSLKF